MSKNELIGAVVGVVVVMGMGYGAAAGETEDRPHPNPLPKGEGATVSFYFENDSRVLKPNGATDRHYTNGMGISIAHQPEWAERVADWVGGGDAAAGYIVGQLMFTPEDIRRRTPDPDDQPYAGYVFGGVYLQRDNGDRERGVRATVLDHVQLDLGYIGPEAGAEDLQVNYHDLVGADDPRGWGSQLDDEVTGQLTYRRKWRADLFGLADGTETPLALQGQAIPYAGFAVGSVHRHAEAGATLRVGWNLPDDFGPRRLADPAAATGDLLSDGRMSVYGFARVGGRAVEHNLFLDGNNFRDSPGVDSEPLVGEAQAGAAAAYRVHERVALELIYSQTVTTRQFEGQEGTDSFGALTASFTCWF